MTSDKKASLDRGAQEPETWLWQQDRMGPKLKNRGQQTTPHIWDKGAQDVLSVSPRRPLQPLLTHLEWRDQKEMET